MQEIKLEDIKLFKDLPSLSKMIAKKETAQALNDIFKEMIESEMCPCSKKCINAGIPHAELCPIQIIRKRFTGGR